MSVILTSASFLFAEEELTVTTYYPITYGTYKQVRLLSGVVPTSCLARQEGAVRYDQNDHELYVCDDGPSGYKWRKVSSSLFDSDTRVVTFPPSVGNDGTDRLACCADGEIVIGVLGGYTTASGADDKSLNVDFTSTGASNPPFRWHPASSTSWVDAAVQDPQCDNRNEGLYCKCAYIMEGFWKDLNVEFQLVCFKRDKR